jgi:hypothetical protein
MTNRNPHSGNDNLSGSRDVRELRSKFVNDYLTTARESGKKRTDAPESARRTEQAELVFSVFDDFKLYGSTSLEREFASRQRDPYQNHKQDLLARAERLGAPEPARDTETESNSNIALAMIAPVLPVTQVAMIGQVADAYERRNNNV